MKKFLMILIPLCLLMAAAIIAAVALAGDNYTPANTKKELRDRWNTVVATNDLVIALDIEDGVAYKKEVDHNNYHSGLARGLAVKAVKCLGDYPAIPLPVTTEITKIVAPTIEGKDEEETNDAEKAALKVAEETYPKSWNAYLANQRNRRAYVDKLEVVVSYYLEEATKAEDHCQAVIPVVQSSNGSGVDTGYTGSLGNVLPDGIEWGGYPVHSPGPEAGSATPIPIPVPTTPSDPEPVPTPTPDPVPTPVPAP
ncbi:MAG: hypothetical protein AAB632_00010 [Patescibacteria group bacterium]